MRQIQFRILDDSLSAVELDDAVHELREELLQLDIDSAVVGVGPAPVGARGTELIEAALLVVETVLDTGMAKAIAERVREWFTRNRVGRLEVTVGDDRLVLTNATADEQERLIAHFVAATSAKSDG